MSDFDFSKVPTFYQFCFNSQCPRSGECLRFLAGQHVPATLQTGMAIYPTAVRDGQCEFFRHTHVLRMAWGFDNIYTPLKSYFRPMARKAVRDMFGSEGTYYRYHHGERKLTPEQQEQVAQILKKYDYDGPVTFTHYENTYDFGI